jgi:hypothetical protein
MKSISWALVIFTLILTACSGEPQPTPQITPIQQSSPIALVHVNPLPTDRGVLFSGSGACAACHTKMIDGAGNDVSTDRLWRATMMANAARDPYWLASVRVEGLKRPEYREIIEDKCATCHMPMARFTAFHLNEEEYSTVFEGGFADTTHDLHPLAWDGVSCTLCHQFEDDLFGETESYSGGINIDTDLAAGERFSYGPYQIPPGMVNVMQSASGFIPQYAAHMEAAELCGTCHTLFTPFFDSTGEIAGEFPEQMTYLEWLNSSYKGTQSCQGCHMPLANGNVRLSITGGPPRNPFYNHEFVGGNTYVPRIFLTFGEELHIAASSDQLQNTIDHASNQIEETSAEIEITGVRREGSQLEVDVKVTNLAGHKLPSGFPSRRAWIHFVIRDDNGSVIFESGGYNSQGFINGNQNDETPELYEPHYTLIQAPDQVQIYEAIMQDTEGRVTTILLSASGYTKDNRLLPKGFNINTASGDIAVMGDAAGDPDFVGGSDTITYQIDLSQSKQPVSIEAALLYQTIGFRWSENLRLYQSFETERFIRYYDHIPNLPLTAARTVVEGVR